MGHLRRYSALLWCWVITKGLFDTYSLRLITDHTCGQQICDIADTNIVPHNTEFVIFAWISFVFVWWRGPQQMLRTHRSLEAYCATLWWRWLVFSVFANNGASVEWNWQGKIEVLGKKPVPVPLWPPQIQMDRPGIEPGAPRWEAGD
jgi:hypothetical protein